MKKVKREAAAQRRPAQSERKTAFFPRNDRPYGLKREAFQTEIVLERFTFETGETRGGGTAPPEKGKTFQHPKKNDARRFP